MNRRKFIELLGLAAAGGTVAYSFPSVIVPRNLATVRFYQSPLVYLSNGTPITFGHDWGGFA